MNYYNKYLKYKKKYLMLGGMISNINEEIYNSMFNNSKKYNDVKDNNVKDPIFIIYNNILELYKIPKKSEKELQDGVILNSLMTVIYYKSITFNRMTTSKEEYVPIGNMTIENLSNLFNIKVFYKIFYQPKYGNKPPVYMSFGNDNADIQVFIEIDYPDVKNIYYKDVRKDKAEEDLVNTQTEVKKHIVKEEEETERLAKEENKVAANKLIQSGLPQCKSNDPYSCKI
jgi:hypothetical protein